MNVWLSLNLASSELKDGLGGNGFLTLLNALVQVLFPSVIDVSSVKLCVCVCVSAGVKFFVARTFNRGLELLDRGCSCQVMIVLKKTVCRTTFR